MHVACCTPPARPRSFLLSGAGQPKKRDRVARSLFFSPLPPCTFISRAQRTSSAREHLCARCQAVRSARISSVKLPKPRCQREKKADAPRYLHANATAAQFNSRKSSTTVTSFETIFYKRGTLNIHEFGGGEGGKKKKGGEQRPPFDARQRQSM